MLPINCTIPTPSPKANGTDSVTEHDATIEKESSLSTTRSRLQTVGTVASVAYSARSVVSTLRWAKRLVFAGSTALKIGGAAATPATFGTSALAIGIGFGIDLVIGEAIDAGITMCNGGKQLEEAKDDWIQGGDWLGSKLYQVFA